MTAISMPELRNPMLHHALRRRRLRRRARLCFAGWLVFGAIHIGVWWGAYDDTSGRLSLLSGHLQLPSGLLGLLVWPLLLASTACFVGFLSYRIRRTVTMAPAQPDDPSGS